MEAPLRVTIGMSLGEIRGGSERLLDDFIRYCPGIDVEPMVLFLNDGEWVQDLRDRGVRCDVVDTGRFRQLKANAGAFRRIRGLLADNRPDVILNWIARAHVMMAPAAMATGMGRRLTWFQWLVGGDAIERVATALPARMVFACSEAGERAQRKMWPRRPTALAYPGIEPPDLADAAQLARMRDEIGVPRDATVVGISGRLARWKNQGALLQAAALLRERGRPVHALVIGGEAHGQDAGYGAELERLAHELGIAEHTTFTGHRRDAAVLTQVMDIAVNASDPEPFGLVVLEAMAGRRPVVAVASGGPAEIVEDGVSGTLVPSPSPEALAAGLEPLVGDEALRRRMGDAGRERALGAFSLARFAEAIRGGLDRVVASP